MSFQELIDKYKNEVCPYCKNANPEDCNICKTLDGVRCLGYMKNKSKIKKSKMNNCYVEWQF